MNRFLDSVLVGSVLLASAGYAVMALGPRSLRPQILAAMGTVLTRAPSFLRLGRLAERLEAAAALKAKGACGGCDNCGTEHGAAAPPAASQSTAQQSSARPSAAEIHIPVSKIGRRA